jgi:hypothetical protein
MSSLDDALSFKGVNASETPIYYPDATGSDSASLLDNRRNWRREQARLIACESISEFELSMLVKFEMLKWLGCTEGDM